MVFIMRPNSTLKFCIIFGFSECLWAIFSLLNFENFGFIFGLSLYDFWFYETNDFKPPLTPCHADEWKTWVQRLNIFQNVEKSL